MYILVMVKWKYRGLSGMIGPRERRHVGHSPLEPIKDRPWMTTALSIFIVLSHIQNNGTDEPITSSDLVIEARS